MKVEDGLYFESRHYGDRWRQVLATALKDNSLIPLHELIRLEQRGDDLSYACAWSLVTFLIEQKGGSNDRFKTYCKLLKEKGYSKDSFEQVFGEPQVLESEWKQFIQTVIDDQATRRQITH